MRSKSGYLDHGGLMAWMPVSAAAVELGIGREEVVGLVEDGVLDSLSVKGALFVTCRSVEARVALLRSEGGA